jgi:hypothetical protein
MKITSAMLTSTSGMKFQNDAVRIVGAPVMRGAPEDLKASTIAPIQRLMTPSQSRDDLGKLGPLSNQCTASAEKRVCKSRLSRLS